LHAFLDTIAAHRAVLERQLDDLNATLAELAAYEKQGRALLSASAEKRSRRAAVAAASENASAKKGANVA
jgi:ABC-type transporter Mla subunit MlaD